MTKTTPLFPDGDPRYGAIYDEMRKLINERRKGLLLCGVIGVLRLLEHQIIEENLE